MNKLPYLLVLLAGIFFFTSCENDEDTVDETYKQAQEAAFNAKGNDPTYQKAEIPGGPGYVYYKVLEPAIENVTPIYTSLVEVYYKGYLTNGTVFDSREKGSAATPFMFKIDGTSFTYKDPTTGVMVKPSPIPNVIAGWKVALQNMKLGEKWEVWIPWTLGYGSGGSGTTIPPYSTLIFEIKLVKVEK